MSLLIQTPDAVKPSVIYPVLQTTVIKRVGGFNQEYFVPSCCFHDMFSSDSQELAGMGLAIIGNIMKHIDKGDINSKHTVKLNLLLAKGAKPIKCPFPGMNDDRPLPLDFEKLPWQSTMFLSDQGNFKFRMDRWQLMHRIEKIWVPWLIGKLQVRL